MAVPALALNDGTTIPALGFGTFPLRGEPAYAAVRDALESGFRLIDTAANYRNEVEVGRAVRDFARSSGVGREEFVVQTKIPAHLHDYDKALQACHDSRDLLGVDRLDMVLLHSPNFMTGKYLEAWRALVELQQSGAARTIGVSNFTPQSLTDIITGSGVTPAVNQVELHPARGQDVLRAEHARLGIVTQAWGPLASGLAPFPAPAIAEAARAHGVTPERAVLRWHVELGVVPLAMSPDPVRQREYLDLFGFELSPEEVAAISASVGSDGGFAPGR